MGSKTPHYIRGDRDWVFKQWSFWGICTPQKLIPSLKPLLCHSKSRCILVLRDEESILILRTLSRIHGISLRFLRLVLISLISKMLRIAQNCSNVKNKCFSSA